MAPRWLRCPIIVSSSFAVKVLGEIIFLIEIVQAINLLSGREMTRRQKLMCYPKMIFSSLSPTSADSLFRASISSLGIGSSGCFGWAVAWIASSPAATHLARLSVPGMSTVRGIMSSMQMSWVSLGFTSMSTINSFLMLKGMLSSMTVGGGTKFWVGECRLAGSHESSCKMAVARSQMGSENTPHLFGQGDPPNVRRRYRRIRLLAGSWVQHWIAVTAERLHRQKADLKLILLAMICLLGYFLREATVQLTSLLRQVLFTHGMSNSLMVLLLTNVPDPLHL